MTCSRRRGLFRASAGNFGQTVAYAARKHRLPLTVYTAENANAPKVARMRLLGATVRLGGSDFDDAKLEAKAFAAETGATMLEDGLNPEVGGDAGARAVGTGGA